MWFDEIRTEMAALSPAEIQEPEATIDEKDHVVGVMSEDLRRLWTLSKKYMVRIAKKTGEALSAVEDKKVVMKAMYEVRGIKMREEIISALFLMELLQEFPELATYPNAYVAKDWRVAYRK